MAAAVWSSPPLPSPQPPPMSGGGGLAGVRWGWVFISRAGVCVFILGFPFLLRFYGGIKQTKGSIKGGKYPQRVAK